MTTNTHSKVRKVFILAVSFRFCYRRKKKHGDRIGFVLLSVHYFLIVKTVYFAEW